MKKIAISGTHSSGKTTLLHGLAFELKKRGARVQTLSESAREIRGYGLPLNRETTFESQLAILTNMMQKELIHSTNRDIDILLSDRSVLDQIPYSRLGKLLELEFQTIVDITKSYLKIRPYNLILILNGNSHVEEDGVRDNSTKYLEEIREQFNFIYRSMEFWEGWPPIPLMNVRYGLDKIDNEIDKIINFIL